VSANFVQQPVEPRCADRAHHRFLADAVGISRSGHSAVVARVVELEVEQPVLVARQIGAVGEPAQGFATAEVCSASSRVSIGGKLAQQGGAVRRGPIL
jgi:hypothetical protein